jgi:hypothetical protein
VAQADARRALEESERRIAALQAEQIKEAQARSEQQRRAFAEADRSREAEQRYEESLQTQARAQQSKPLQPQDEEETPQISPEPSVAIVPTSAVEPQPRRYLFVRKAGFVLMIGSSFGALFILFRIVREWLTH